MSEPTNTRQTLRREIALDLGMPFFRRFPSGIAVQDTTESGLKDASDSTGIRDSRLTQHRNFWLKTWVYDVSNDTMRMTKDFLQESNTLVPEWDWDQAPTTGTTIEIHSIWNPQEIHQAINDGIQEAFPAFFDVVTSEDIIIEENKLEYDLVTNNSDGRGILSNPFRIKSIEIEQTHSGSTHTATNGDTASITDSTEDFSSLDTNWSVSIYDGTGSGQYGVVTMGDTAGVVTVDNGFVVSPDTSSKFRLWKRGEEIFTWRPVTAIQFDAKDYPSKMRFLERYPADRGMRMRIQYIGEPQPLSVDSATTVIPKRYIKAYALSKLYGMRARSKPGEMQKYATLEATEMEKADRFKVEHHWDMPDQTLWTEYDMAGYGAPRYGEINDPLDWGR